VREETGLTAIRDVGGLLEILDVAPDDDYRIRTHVYAGGGSSFVPARLLASSSTGQKGMRHSIGRCGMGCPRVAHGFEVLFCPQSKAWHAHEAQT